MRNHLAVMLLIVALGACNAPRGALPVSPIPLRNPTYPVASQSDVTDARLAGDWTVIEAAGVAPGTRVRVTEGSLSLDGEVSPLSRLAPGRYDTGARQLWVHWIDADNRTAAVGDPAGSQVWIMDRGGAPGERLGAARTILEWYGYDLARMAGR